MPLLEKQNWKNLFEFHKQGEFLEANNFYPYYEIPIILKNQCLTENEILDLIGKIESRITFIIGKAGSGKSLLIRRLVFLLASKFISESIISDGYGANEEKIVEEDDYIIHDIGEELETLPKTAIPIFLSLRCDFPEINDFQKDLESHLSNILNLKTDEEIPKLEGFFSIPGTKWILFLDGFDELHNIEDRGPKLYSWIKRLPKNVTAVITTRPGISLGEPGVILNLNSIQDREQILNLLNLKLNYAISDVNGEIRDTYHDIMSNYLEWLKNDSDEIMPLFGNFRAIDGFVDYILGKMPWVISEEDIDNVIVDGPYFKWQHPKGKSSKILPVYSSEIDFVSSDGFDLVPLKNEQIDQTDNQPILEGPMIRSIVKFIRKENLKRHPAGILLNKDEKARNELQKLAWYVDWSANFYNRDWIQTEKFIDEESIDWNENLGFLVCNPREKINFIYKYFQLYCAAEYACNYSKGQLHSKDHPDYSQVVKLHNQLMQDDGYEPILS